MSDLNKKLGALAALLFALSALSFVWDARRAERFERGQSFLSNLNPDEVSRITLRKGSETTTLVRNGEGFKVEERNGYRATNQSVNRLLRNLLDISLAREVGSGESLAEELELEPMKENSLEAVLENSAGQQMVSVRVGKRAEGGSGNYIQRRDSEEQTIFLSESGVFLDTDASSFLDKEIVDVSSSEISRIEGVDFLIAKGEGDGGAELALVDVPVGLKEKTSETTRLESLLNRLRFEEVFLADDPEVASLAFAPVLEIGLEDQSSYVLAHARKDDRHFLQIGARYEVGEVLIARDESDEELQKKADQVNRAEDIKEFNSYHGSWVYEISSATGEKLELRRRDLTESS